VPAGTTMPNIKPKSDVLTDAALQTLPSWTTGLLQLASPVLPIGAFSYSQGLEQANAEGWVLDENGAGDWITSQWQCAFAPRELRALQDAYLANDLQALLDINEEFLASRDSAEVRLETMQTGSSLMKWLRSMQEVLQVDAELLALIASLVGHKLTAPIAFSLCAKAQHLPLEAARLAWSWSWLENQVQAAVKIVPLGQTAGQRLLIRLRPLLLQPVLDEDAWSFSPLGAIAAMRHERLYTRIFRS
jgi:urease accessory protein